MISPVLITHIYSNKQHRQRSFQDKMSTLISCILICILLASTQCQRRPGEVCAGCPVEQSPHRRDVRLAASAAIRQLGPGHRLLWIYRAQTAVRIFLYLNMFCFHCCISITVQL